MPHRNVLRVNAVEETEAYRSAVAEILRRVQSEHELTLLEISERSLWYKLSRYSIGQED